MPFRGSGNYASPCHRVYRQFRQPKQATVNRCRASSEESALAMCH